MTKLVTAVGLMVAAATAVLWLASPPSTGSARIVPAPEVGGVCGCPKYYRCCLDCNGNPLCVRSISQCPECPAP